MKPFVSSGVFGIFRILRAVLLRWGVSLWRQLLAFIACPNLFLLSLPLYQARRNREAACPRRVAPCGFAVSFRTLRVFLPLLARLRCLSGWCLFGVRFVGCAASGGVIGSRLRLLGFLFSPQSSVCSSCRALARGRLPRRILPSVLSGTL